MGKGGKGKGKAGKSKGKKGGAKAGDAPAGDGEESVQAPNKTSELHTAARSGDIEKLQSLLKADESKESIDAGDHHRRSPLHLAAFFGHIAAVTCLLDGKADVQRTATDGYLGLHFAAQQGHLEVVRALLGHLRTHGERGSIKKHVNRIVDKGKKSALHLALQKGHEDLARFLAMKGSSLEATTAQGQTAEDLCKTPELKAELRGASAVAASAAAEEGGGDVTDEPPAKRRELEPGLAETAAEKLAASLAAPEVIVLARQSAAEKSASETVEGVLFRGPIALSKVVVTAAATERAYPAGISALADVHWTGELAETPDLKDGPVWCISQVQQQPPEAVTDRTLQLAMQRSSHKLLLFTHFSEEADMVAKDDRCNACSLTLLLETADGLLVLHKPKEGQLWQTLPRSRIVGSADLGPVLQSMLKEAGQADAPSDSVSSTRLLALVDAGESAPDGYRHELVFCLRLAFAADVVQQACAASGEEPLFVRAPHATAAGGLSDDESILAIRFSAALGGSFSLAKSARRALLLFQELASAVSDAGKAA